ncbi:MAG: arylesterase [Alphaproteobacteria bacterium]|nr:arylesterase [Alphaproteobacteria bacterium]
MRVLQGLVLGLLLLPSTMAAAKPIKLLALGDSLVAGYGLREPEGFVPNLEAALREKGFDVTVINGGVSGDTSKGGLSRLDWSLADDPDAAILELGANDGLRGIDPASTKQNLSQIIERFQAEGIEVLLAGMMAPPNFGPEYTSEFNGLYPALAEAYGIALYPFFLDGVAAEPSLNQGDGIHPNEKGVDIIVERITPYVTDLLESVQ